MTKIQMFGWRLMSQCLLLWSKLHRLIPAIDPLCVLCGQDEETYTHLFFHCPRNNQIWLHYGFNFPALSAHISFQDMIRYVLHGHGISAADQTHKALIICWCIWTNRNDQIFKNKAYCVLAVQRSIEVLFFAYIHPLQPILNYGGQFNRLAWCKPARGALKLNIDAAFEGSMVAAGMVLRDSNGLALMVAGHTRTLLNAQVAEAWTMLKCLQLIDKYKLNSVVVETDNLYVATLLLEVNLQPSWQLRDLVMECRSILTRNVSIVISFARQEVNFVAHSIAKYTLAQQDEFEVHFEEGCLPSNIEEPIHDVC